MKKTNLLSYSVLALILALSLVGGSRALEASRWPPIEPEWRCPVFNGGIQIFNRDYMLHEQLVGIIFTLPVDDFILKALMARPPVGHVSEAIYRQWIRNTKHFVSTRHDWNAHQKASVLNYMFGLIRDHLFETESAAWQVSMIPRRDCIIFAGPGHRLVVEVASAKMFEQVIPKLEEREIESHPLGREAHYLTWPCDPHGTGMKEIRDPHDATSR